MVSRARRRIRDLPRRAADLLDFGALEGLRLRPTGVVHVGRLVKLAVVVHLNRVF